MDNPEYLNEVYLYLCYITNGPGRVARSVTCLATDASLTADPGVASSIPAWSHTFVEIDHEIISTIIRPLPLNHSRRVVVSHKRKYVHEVLVNCLIVQACPGNSVLRWFIACISVNAFYPYTCVLWVLKGTVS